mmetsp:Transcript_28377/g.51593  ORF Transcript_28377/g.51593 Transcript_28377/m.51593 type:complete len:655 (+) Transcript_28377:60-2024(+)
MAPVDVPEDEPHGQIAIYYGSQTGTAEEVASDLAREGARRGFDFAHPGALNDLTIQDVANLRIAIFVVATTGQGDPPVNMRWLWEALVAASLPKTLLGELQFAVFGLGDSHYREFNYAARKLHARLQQLGAQPFYRLGLGDDQHDFGLEQELDPWADGLWEALAKLNAPTIPAGAHGMMEALPFEIVEVLEEQPAGSPGTVTDETFQAKMLENDCLCSADHAMEEQDVRNLRLQVPPGVSFVAGDVCVVWPQTDTVVVTRFIVETLSMSPDMRVRVTPSSSSKHASAGSSVRYPTNSVTLRELFTHYVDISAVPTRHFFDVLSRYTDHELHKKKLTEFASRTLEAKDALYEYCKREKRSAEEVMWDFWTARPPLAALLEALPPMRPRRYSIASCPAWHSTAFAEEGRARFWCDYQRTLGCWWQRHMRSPSAVIACAEAFNKVGGDQSLDLCVAVVKFTTKTGRECKGLCSSFLQQRALGSSMSCSIEKGSLSLPPADVPLILVCPGTGLSPCRALIQQRHLDFQRRGTPPRRLQRGLKDMMFLGFRHRYGDFLYQGEWETFSSWLQVHTAFSRDDPERKIYVQDKIEECGKQVCDLIDAGAQIYVCGRAHPMPAQVFDAFCEVLQVHRGLTLEGSATKLRELQQRRRYVCDTWG